MKGKTAGYWKSAQMFWMKSIHGETYWCEIWCVYFSQRWDFLDIIYFIPDKLIYSASHKLETASAVIVVRDWQGKAHTMTLKSCCLCFLGNLGHRLRICLSIMHMPEWIYSLPNKLSDGQMSNNDTYVLHLQICVEAGQNSKGRRNFMEVTIWTFKKWRNGMH